MTQRGWRAPAKALLGAGIFGATLLGGAPTNAATVPSNFAEYGTTVSMMLESFFQFSINPPDCFPCGVHT